MAILYDGHTKTNINSLPEEAWRYLSGESEDGGLQELQKKVPWLYRGMEIRGLSVSSIPFALYKGENEIDSSENWENKSGILPHPKQMLRMIEMSMVLFGKAYLAQPKNRYGFAKELRYLVPSTIRPVITSEGLTGFKRTLGGEDFPMSIEELVYFWGLDPYVEIGPPHTSPATAAMAAAGVLMNVDQFAEAFFKRGAIKATILSVPHGTQTAEKEKLEKWYTRVAAGISNAFTTKVLNADAVSATTIGEGIEGLENTELSKEKREDISTALGIPQSKLFSSSATDSNRVEDEKSYLNDLIVPESHFLAEIWNDQVWKPMGYRWEFHPEQMAIFQEDEVNRSAAFMNYVSALGKDKAGLVGEMIGLDLPDQYDYEDLNSEPMPVPDFTPSRIEEDKQDEREKFYRYVKNGRDIDKFVFNYLDEMEQEALKARYAVPDYQPLVKSLTDAISAVREHPGENIVYITNEIKGD